MCDTILVATDGSEHADRAVRRAVALAREHGARLHALAVVDRRVREEPGMSTEALVTIEAEDRYGDCLADVERRAEGAGIDVECEVAHGVPHDAILAYADRIDADVVLLGAHGDHETHISGVGRKVRRGTDREVRVVEARDRGRPT